MTKADMNAERRRKAEELFQLAVDMPSDDRPAFLERHCGSDATLRAEVERLLGTDDSEMGDFMGSVRPAAAQTVRDTLPTSSMDTTAIAHGRFIPGTMLTKRYRVVGLLGKGGMGEVYRADDLELGQSVALKFLPKDIGGDRTRLDRFRNEVRVARQVSHPNVCRVYDIGEADGQVFLSMEYIDGEDLAAVLRRMGRPSKDKAIQIARQLCAGLSAAHENGLLHRDLKPANVMIDGRGRARVTDFGLAGLADSFQAGEFRAGTPAYMAPEQLAGKEVSVRSDIYALGIVLFEVFTGKRVFEAGSIAELRRLHESSSPTSPSSIVDDMDPAIERVILRCLEKDPRQRPTSALAVAAALPGGDPLAAALAAGETPAPEMVANAGESGGLRPAIAVSFLIAFLVGVGVIVALSPSRQLVQQVPMPHPPAVLAAKAQDIIKRLGYSDPPVDSAKGFHRDGAYLDHIKENDESMSRWDQLADGRPAAIHFWYRQSPRTLLATNMEFGGSKVLPEDPPPDVSGMINLELDPEGRLIQFLAIPPQREIEAAESPQVDWTQLFEEADLDPTRFKPSDPSWNPRVWADDRAAWEGTHPKRADIPLRVEAAGYRGRPVQFELIWPWTRASRMEPEPTKPGELAANVILVVLFLSILIGSALVARRNLRMGRGDRRGAFRVAMFVLAVVVIEWVFDASHVPTFWELGMFLMAVSWGGFVACMVWLLYIALEPYARRRWPQAMISWARVLSGRLRDPLVGRDVLAGALVAIVLFMIGQLSRWMPIWLGDAPPAPRSGQLQALLGARHVVATVFERLPGNLFFPLGIFFLLFLLRMFLRKQWLAAAALVLLFGALGFLTADSPVIALLRMLPVILFVVVLTRLGILALMVGFFVNSHFQMLPITPDLSAWYAGATIFGLLICVAVAVYGFHTALAGRPLFKDELLEA